ncbi:MAG TPA: hypothetical protein VFR63_09185 [Gaiellaceae bacterium]|nr:hypothetical protein [Gaiellaceae bacterium]
MDDDEARRILRDEVSKLRAQSYAELRDALLDSPRTFEVVGESGTRYQVEAEAIWDGGRGGDLRVLAAVDDGGWRALKPLTESFIVASDGSFVGE